MQKVKTVRRKNKAGQTVVYEYPAIRYSKTKNKGYYNLVTKSKSGKINIRHKNIERFKAELIADKTAFKEKYDLTEGEFDDIINGDLIDYVNTQAAAGKTVTTTGFMGHTVGNNVDKFFANMGHTAKEVADELGIDLEVLRDSKNWKDDIFTSPGGIKFVFRFNYNAALDYIVVA